MKPISPVPPDYDTRVYSRGDIIPSKLVPVQERVVRTAVKPGDPIPPSMDDGPHYRWDGNDFIAVPPQTGGPWALCVVVPQGTPSWFNTGGL